MSQYEFFKGCLNATEAKFNQILRTPRARGAHLQKELNEILAQIDKAYSYGELTQTEYRELKAAFIKFDFCNMSLSRAALRGGKL